MPRPKGYPKTGGRQKGKRNRVTEEVAEFLNLNKLEILQLAFDRAMAGSDTILCKLLDKIVPSLAHNKNENENKTFEDFLKERKENKLKVIEFNSKPL